MVYTANIPYYKILKGVMRLKHQTMQPFSEVDIIHLSSFINIICVDNDILLRLQSRLTLNQISLHVLCTYNSLLLSHHVGLMYANSKIC